MVWFCSGILLGVFLGVRGFGGHGDDLIIHPAPYAIIPEPSVVYDGVYEAAKNNGREYGVAPVMH